MSEKLLEIWVRCESRLREAMADERGEGAVTFVIIVAMLVLLAVFLAGWFDTGIRARVDNIDLDGV